MTLFCPRSPPFMSSNGIFLQAEWSKIKERVEGGKSGKKMWFKRITVWKCMKANLERSHLKRHTFGRDQAIIRCWPYI